MSRRQKLIDRLTAGSAQLLLPANGTLIRRIKMLRKNGFRNEKRLPIGGRLAVAVLIGAMTLGLTMLRGQSDLKQSDKSSGESKETAKLPPFDFKYVLKDATMMWGVRPSLMYSSPEAYESSSLFSGFGEGPPMEMIEHIIISSKTRELNGKPWITATMISRTVVPYFWAAHVRRDMRKRGKPPIEFVHNNIPCFMLTGRDGFACVVPDSRTMVYVVGFIGVHELQEIIDSFGEEKSIAKIEGVADAKRGSAFYIIDSKEGRRIRGTELLESYEPLLPQKLDHVLVKHADSCTMIVEGDKDLSVSIEVQSESENAAAKVHVAMGNACLELAESLRPQEASDSSDDDNKLLTMYANQLARPSLVRDGDTVKAEFQFEGGFGTLSNALSKIIEKRKSKKR